MKASFSFFVLFLVLSIAHAAPIERDLGEGLRYFRIHDLPADLPPAVSKSRAFVLDLRYTKATAPGAEALDAWLKSHAMPDAPVFVLLNSDTASALRPAFVAGRRPGVGVVTLAPASTAFTPDIALDVAPADDRRAYDAFEQGTTIDTLVTENPDKPRHDEADIARERTNPPADADDLDALADDSATGKKETVVPPPPVIDALLQRAIQLHRGLRALHRIN